MPVDYGVATTPTTRPQTFDGNGQNPPSVDAGVARTPTTRPDTLDGNPERKIIPPAAPGAGPYVAPYSGPAYAITGTDPNTASQVVGGSGGTALSSVVPTAGAYPSAVGEFLYSLGTTSNAAVWGTIVAGPGIQIATGGTTSAPTLTFTEQPALAEVLSNGELSMNVDAGGADSATFSQTPASQQLSLTFFRAKSSWSSMQYLTFMVAGTIASGLTTVYAGLYSYDGVSSLTRMDLTAESHSSWNGGSTYSARKLALVGGTSNITAGQLYAVALLQVGTTPASLYGSNGYTSYTLGQSGNAWKCGVLTGQSTLPSTIATSGLSGGTGPWRMLASVTTS